VPAWVLSVTVRLAAALLPLEVNVTEMVQNLPAASELDEFGQLLVWEKLLEFVPVIPMLVMINGVVPVLVSVTGSELLLLEATVPKLRLGLRVATE
jgi:hypothetical protein